MNFSYWEFDFYLKNIDFAIIGGGIVGMSCAYHLKEKYPNSRIVVFERDFFSAGASSRNAGFACFGSPTELLSDAAANGWDAVLPTVQNRFAGLRALQSIIPMEAMDGSINGGVEIFEAHEMEKFHRVLDELDDINAKVKDVLGFAPYHEVPNAVGLKNVIGSIQIDQEGMIHPGKMLGQWLQINRALGIEVLYGLNIETIDVESGSFEIRGRRFQPGRLVVCTNGLTPSLIHGLDVIPARNQVIVTNEVLDTPWDRTFHLREGYVYFRNIGKRVLIGGGRDLFREQESTLFMEETENVRLYLKATIEKFLGKTVEIEHHWSGIMGMGETKGPIIKPLSEKTYVAVRMGGMGVAIGTWVGKELAYIME
jgi:glycine/D-amino acid oxidase-like deaminating enzyme